MRLNLGCGTDLKDGFENIDREIRPGMDAARVKMLDLEAYPWPWPDGSIEEVAAHQMLEHIGNLERFLAELRRVCAAGATIKISVPHCDSVGAWSDPGHRRAFNTRCMYAICRFGFAIVETHEDWWPAAEEGCRAGNIVTTFIAR